MINIERLGNLTKKNPKKVFSYSNKISIMNMKNVTKADEKIDGFSI